MSAKLSCMGFAARAIFQDETKNSAFLKMSEKDLR